MDEYDKRTYSKIRRDFINLIKQIINERDEGKVSSIFSSHLKNKKEYILLFLEHNAELSDRYFDILFYEHFHGDRFVYSEYKSLKTEIFNVYESSSLELAHYFIIYVTVEEFNLQLREIKLPFAKELNEETICDSTINESYYFRGQTQGWPISPSVLRGLKDNVKINIDGLMHLYDENGLLTKYNELYCDYTSQTNVYYKIAFIQHACSFSPFIDFSKKPIVATSFALSNTNQFNVFRSEKSYVYRLIIENNIRVINSKKEASDFLKGINHFCIHINDNFCYGKSYEYEEYHKGISTTKILTINTPTELYNALKPKLVIFDSPTNDRMKYQSGVFALFYDYVSFKGELRYWYAPGFSILSYPINPKSKRKIINSIRGVSGGWYESDLLVNPYEIFNK